VRGLLGEKVRTIRHFLGLLELQKQGLQKETTSLVVSIHLLGALGRPPLGGGLRLLGTGHGAFCS